MKIPKKVKSLDEVAEKYRGLYAETDDGGFVLEVEVEDPRLKEFRETNIALKKQNEELLKRFEGIDPEKHRKLVDSLDQEEEKKLLKAGDVEALISRRTESVKRSMNAELAKIAEERDRLAKSLEGASGRLSRFVLEDAIRGSVSKVAKIRPGAEEDLMLRARGVFRVDAATGQMIPDAAGEMVYGPDGEPLTVEAWAKSIVPKAEHLFVPPQGADAKGSPTGAGGFARPMKTPTDPVEFGKQAEAIAKAPIAKG